MISQSATNRAISRLAGKKQLVAAFFLALATLTAFGRVCGNDFLNYDDRAYVVRQPGVRGGLGPAGLSWALTTTSCANWHPLTWISFQADHDLFGLHPWGYHLTNLVLHVANALLLFMVLCRMTSTLWPSAIVAGLFALHPLHVESVAWVAERKDVLSTLFWMLTLAAYARYVEQPGLRRYLLVAMTFALGLTAKSMLVTLPVVLLLLDYWPLRRISPPPLRGDGTRVRGQVSGAIPLTPTLSPEGRGGKGCWRWSWKSCHFLCSAAPPVQ